MGDCLNKLWPSQKTWTFHEFIHPKIAIPSLRSSKIIFSIQLRKSPRGLWWPLVYISYLVDPLFPKPYAFDYTRAGDLNIRYTWPRINVLEVRKGQIKPKAVWARRRFTQKPIKFFFCLPWQAKKQTKQIRLFIFWEKLADNKLLLKLTEL